ncbi:single-strand binding protein [Spirosomataceae bacterium TFI 002]|nr:single-strand binding protein [Spirosomataceae bacterium TFI 002]
MAGLNKVLLIGNVGGDPEIRSLPSGSKVANFSLATSESYNDKSGQKQTVTEWHRIELWDGLATIAERYVKKGDPIYIEGKIRNERWTDKDGQEKTGVRIRGLSMQMLGSARGGDNNYGNQEDDSQSSGHTLSEPDNSLVNNGGEDDLPF